MLPFLFRESLKSFSKKWSLTLTFPHSEILYGCAEGKSSSTPCGHICSPTCISKSEAPYVWSLSDPLFHDLWNDCGNPSWYWIRLSFCLGCSGLLVGLDGSLWRIGSFPLFLRSIRLFPLALYGLVSRSLRISYGLRVRAWADLARYSRNKCGRTKNIFRSTLTDPPHRIRVL